MSEQTVLRVPWTRPDCVSHLLLQPRVHLVALLGLRTQLVAGDPEVGCFHRRMRAGGSRRRGQAASLAWSIACGLVREHPGQYPVRLHVTRLAVDGVDQLIVGPEGACLGWAALGEIGLSLPSPVVVRVDNEVRIEVTNHDFRPAAADLALLWRRPS